MPKTHIQTAAYTSGLVDPGGRIPLPHHHHTHTPLPTSGHAVVVGPCSPSLWPLCLVHTYQEEEGGVRTVCPHLPAAFYHSHSHGDTNTPTSHLLYKPSEIQDVGGHWTPTPSFMSRALQEEGRDLKVVYTFACHGRRRYPTTTARMKDY